MVSKLFVRLVFSSCSTVQQLGRIVRFILNNSFDTEVGSNIGLSRPILP